MDRRIETILLTLDRDPSVLWNIAALAKLVGLSISRLRHLFRHEMGTALTQHLKEVRLRRAEHLLRTSFLSVKQIAEEAGHISGSHFSREFKKVFGVSPTAYRRRFGTSSRRQKVDC